MKKRIETLLLSALAIGLLAIPATKPARAAEPPKTCVVSILFDEKVDQQIEDDSNALLEQMGYPRGEQRFVYKKGDLAGIRECLQGEYEDVILISHSRETIKGRPAFVYPVKKPDENVVFYPALSRRFFENLEIKPTLRQITLVICDAESVVENYNLLRDLAHKYKLRIKLQPSSVAASVMTGTTRDRAQYMIPSTIAESAQDETSATIYCTLQSTILFLFEHGDGSCLRNHYNVSLLSPFAFGFKSTVRWLKLSVSPKRDVSRRVSLLDAEFGFFKGAEFNVSSQPFKTNNESWGFSIAPLQYISVERLHEKEFGDDSYEPEMDPVSMAY